MAQEIATQTVTSAGNHTVEAHCRMIWARNVELGRTLPFTDEKEFEKWALLHNDYPYDTGTQRICDKDGVYHTIQWSGHIMHDGAPFVMPKEMVYDEKNSSFHCKPNPHPAAPNVPVTHTAHNEELPMAQFLPVTGGAFRDGVTLDALMFYRAKGPPYDAPADLPAHRDTLAHGTATPGESDGHKVTTPSGTDISTFRAGPTNGMAGSLFNEPNGGEVTFRPYQHFFPDNLGQPIRNNDVNSKLEETIALQYDPSGKLRPINEDAAYISLNRRRDSLYVGITTDVPGASNNVNQWNSTGQGQKALFALEALSDGYDRASDAFFKATGTPKVEDGLKLVQDITNTAFNPIVWSASHQGIPAPKSAFLADKLQAFFDSDQYKHLSPEDKAKVDPYKDYIEPVRNNDILKLNALVEKNGGRGNWDQPLLVEGDERIAKLSWIAENFGDRPNQSGHQTAADRVARAHELKIIYNKDIMSILRIPTAKEFQAGSGLLSFPSETVVPAAPEATVPVKPTTQADVPSKIAANSVTSSVASLPVKPTTQADVPAKIATNSIPSGIPAPAKPTVVYEADILSKANDDLGAKLLSAPVADQDAVINYVLNSPAAFQTMIVNPLHMATIPDNDGNQHILGFNEHPGWIGRQVGSVLTGDVHDFVESAATDIGGKKFAKDVTHEEAGFLDGALRFITVGLAHLGKGENQDRGLNEVDDHGNRINRLAALDRWNDPATRDRVRQGILKLWAAGHQGHVLGNDMAETSTSFGLNQQIAENEGNMALYTPARDVLDRLGQGTTVDRTMMSSINAQANLNANILRSNQADAANGAPIVTRPAAEVQAAIDAYRAGHPLHITGSAVAGVALRPGQPVRVTALDGIDAARNAAGDQLALAGVRAHTQDTGHVSQEEINLAIVTDSRDVAPEYLSMMTVDLLADGKADPAKLQALQAAVDSISGGEFQMISGSVNDDYRELINDSVKNIRNAKTDADKNAAELAARNSFKAFFAGGASESGVRARGAVGQLYSSIVNGGLTSLVADQYRVTAGIDKNADVNSADLAASLNARGIDAAEQARLRALAVTNPDAYKAALKAVFADQHANNDTLVAGIGGSYVEGIKALITILIITHPPKTPPDIGGHVGFCPGLTPDRIGAGGLVGVVGSGC